MAIKQTKAGRWLVDIEPVKGQRFRKTFDTKGEALRFEAYTKAKVYSPGWKPKKADNRRMSELIHVWHKYHGQTLRNGKRFHSRLLAICKFWRDPIARKITAEHFSRYRAYRLEDGISARTVNNDLGFVRSFFNVLIDAQVIDFDNPVSAVKALKYQEKELSFLSPEQILELLHHCAGSGNPHVIMLVQICLATGCRWSEAENLKQGSVKHNQLVFQGTKSFRVRSVPVSKELLADLRKHWKIHGDFTFSLSAFRRSLAKCSFTLPDGQASHILRHTFASHFVQQGGNLLVLQKILGHSTITTTMRYAHLAPGHLKEAVLLNPLFSFDTLSTPNWQA